jgi:hypothetical protein
LECGTTSRSDSETKKIIGEVAKKKKKISFHPTLVDLGYISSKTNDREKRTKSQRQQEKQKQNKKKKKRKEEL